MKLKQAALTLLGCFLCAQVSHANLRVGTLFFDPPFVYSLNEGFDIDLIHLLCKGLQEQCLLIPMDYNRLFTALSEGEIDIAVGDVAIAPSNEAGYIFSLPYMLSKGQFMVLKGSPIQTENDLKNKKVGAIKGNPEGGVLTDYLQDNYADMFQVVTYDDIEDVVTALSNKEISAAFLHRSKVVYWIQNGGDLFQALGTVRIVGKGIGVMALPKNADLIKQINQLLQKMEADSTYLNLYKIYFANE